MAGKTPIIVKRKKIIKAAGHHGGAWKVAYADFVTAMMAFFLLMWLLNATTEEQRKGIADYFNPTIPLAPVSGGGTDALAGDSVLTEETLSRSGEHQTANPREAVIPTREALLSELERLALEAGIEDADDRIRVTETPEGTKIEITDAKGEPLFASGSAVKSPHLRELLSIVARTIIASGADVKITGHTDSINYPGNDYTNWELSAERANAARRVLLAEGVPPEYFQEVSGRADRDIIGKNGFDPVNRRIAIVLMSPLEASEDRLR